MIKTYNAFINDCDCCSHVNTNRRNVETRMSIVNGEIASASCSWCGKDVEISKEDILQHGKLNIVILTDDNKEQDFLFEGKVYRGYPLGDKSLQSDK